jgi:C4-dicarboxylate transporter DctM subunit
MIPAMRQRGYDADYAGALVAASSTIGPVIPPSIPMIIYGATVGVSVTKLFVAGVIPGILMGVGLMIVNYFIAQKRGYRGLERSGNLLWILKKCKESALALLMPIIVLGGIYGGIFTPTESAVVGIFYALIVGIFFYRQLTLKKFAEAVIEATFLSSSVMVVLGGATTFGRVLSLERIPDLLAKTMLSVTQKPILIMLMINVVLLIAGMFIDTISNIILFAPLFVPLITTAGYNTTFFGLIMCVNLCIGFLTPPLGVNLFVAQTVAQVSLEAIIHEVLPFLIVLIAVLAILIAFPSVVMFLPNLLGL